MTKSKLQLEQLEAKIVAFSPAAKVAIPPTGWIKATRLSLGISLQQLANKLGITKQSLQELERREQEGGVTLKSLREVARALEMDLVYALVPKDGSLDAMIDRKATELATKIVSRTSASMRLEDQENSEQRIQKAIKERKLAIKNEMPKTLWD